MSSGQGESPYRQLKSASGYPQESVKFRYRQLESGWEKTLLM